MLWVFPDNEFGVASDHWSKNSLTQKLLLITWIFSFGMSLIATIPEWFSRKQFRSFGSLCLTPYFCIKGAYAFEMVDFFFPFLQCKFTWKQWNKKNNWYIYGVERLSKHRTSLSVAF